MITPCAVCGEPCIVEVVYARSDEVAVAYCEQHQGQLKDWLDEQKAIESELERAYYSEISSG